jgi:hypothetical protein
VGDGLAPGSANGRLTSDEVAALAGDLRAGDVWRANEDHPTDQRAAGMASLRYAAIRRGEAEAGDDLGAFLDRIALDDLEAALRARRPPAPTSEPDGSPDSAAIGA